MNVPPPPALDRTPSAHSRYTTAEVWCFERQFEGQELRPPVRIIIFDCDETLTLSTFLPHDDELRTKLDWTSQWEDYIATMNFESPFLTSSRRTLLREMLEELCKGNRRVQGRQLAVLTRNNSGAIACLNLLRAAQLDQYFSAVWGMHHGNGAPAGVYKSSAGWKVFEPPFGLIPDHKAHVLHSIAECPSNWFPQLAENALALPSALRPEEILLVDDVRTNFQSGGTTAKKVFRCCKVARYDAPSFRDMGFVRDMGGIGAHNEEDYKTLVEFANRPWAFNVDCKAYCLERTFEGSEKKPPVKLILFDFDGALTLYTFMPEDPRCSTDISYAPNESVKQRYVQYNFETPYLEGSRVERLASLLKCLAEDPDTGERRVLAILTINEAGAIAVLNVLRMAGLSDSFSVIWTLSTRVGQPGGAYSAYSTDNNSKEWKTFTLPQQIAEGHYKASVIESILASPSAWFPQLSGASPEAQVLTDLCLPNIVLVDDERNICRLEGEYQALRHCRVASYDDEYRDQGLLWHMGGLGAKCLEDYQTVLSFVRQPWQFAEVQMPSRPSFCFGVSDGADHPIELQRSKTELLDLARRLPQFLKTKDLQELARPRSSTVD